LSPLASLKSEIIPGYTIRERIGAGGYGEVWKADAPGGLAKAVKFIYGCHEGERASRELKALNRIKEVRHAFLLSLERIEVIDGQLVIVTELADASLMNRFEECVAAGAPGIPRDELLVYMSDAADALDYMRQAFSLQHLDIKPENLLILSGRVKVGDFGLVKDIQDQTVSLVGGLTPVYAAPEVFMGHPSLHSDQYSLAIVYQEMLTGVLPFSGRNHAQLVMQHQNSSPRLAPLPPDDRPVIARALARNPEDRFPSCRALVDHLRNSGAAFNKNRGGGNSGDRIAETEPESKCPREDTSAAKAVDTVSHEQHKRQKHAAKPAGASGPTVLFDELSRSTDSDDLPSGLGRPKRERKSSSSDDWPFVCTGAAEAVKDLPPTRRHPELPADCIAMADGTGCPDADAEWRLRPCLVLGLGGTAGLVLNGLRQRWSDRFGDPAAVPALQMLLVDGDRRALGEATRGDTARALRLAETICTPLRAPEAYQEASEKYLKWLRRRWLCRIPRSHCPEGLRPLGRLALVDHGREIIDELQAAISRMISPEAIAASGQHIGQEVLPAAPRIVLVASISGGTGSGMLLDAAYMVRKVLADLSLSDARLTAVLVHWTSRDPHGTLLARANACSCLRELRSFGRGEGYPGDADLGLPEFADEIPPFDTIHVAHLGDGLNQDDVEQATENVGQFLDVATATAGGAFFDSVHELDAPEMTVRTFGLTRIGIPRKEFVAQAVDLLCRRTVQRWLGDASGDNAVPLQSLDHLLAQINVLMGTQPPDLLYKEGGDLALNSLAERYAAAMEQAICGHLTSQGGVLAARAAAQDTLDGLSGLRADVNKRLQHLDTLVAQANAAQPPRGYPVTPSRSKTRLARGASGELPAGITPQTAQWNLDIAALQCAAIIFRNLQDQIAAIADSLKNPQNELNDLVAAFSELADDEVAAFLDVGHPELVTELDQEWRTEILGGPGEPAADPGYRAPASGCEPPRGYPGGRLLDRLRRAASTKVIDALRRGEFRDLLPGGSGGAPLEPKLLKSSLEAAEPRLRTCGGGRRSWMIGPCDLSSRSPQAVVELGTAQPPAVAIDAQGDFVVGWEIEGMSLPRVAAELIDNQREAAQLALLLHTRLDIDW
jgi:serine/threonine protein kinase